MKQYRFFIIIILALSLSTVNTIAAKNNEAKKAAKDSTKQKKFKGNILLNVFTNFHMGLNEEFKNNSGFGLDRAEFGYTFKYGENWSGIVSLAVGYIENKDATKLDFVAHVRNASMTYQKKQFNISFGLIKTRNFALQEEMWGYRYVMKSYLDKYGFAPSRDLGVSVAYKPIKWFEADFSFTNGKGTKKIDLDNNYRYGLGLTFEPIENLFIRMYFDLFTATQNSDTTRYNTINNANEYTISAFIGYKNDRFTVGAEYNYQLNYDHTYNEDKDGASVYTSVKIIKPLYVYARFDYIHHFYKGDFYNDNTDEYAIRTGFSYTPVKFLSISPNFYATFDEYSEATMFVYLNLMFKL